MDSGKLYSVEEAAAFLGGISKWTVHAWLAKGKLRRTKVGSRTMVRESDLQAFIARCNPEPETTPTADSCGINEPNVQ
jgi:excisionase family DNA binding protein